MFGCRPAFQISSRPYTAVSVSRVGGAGGGGCGGRWLWFDDDDDEDDDDDDDDASQIIVISPLDGRNPANQLIWYRIIYKLSYMLGVLFSISEPSTVVPYLPSSKLTWQWKSTFSNRKSSRKYIFKWYVFAIGNSLLGKHWYPGTPQGTPHGRPLVNPSLRWARSSVLGWTTGTRGKTSQKDTMSYEASMENKIL